MRKAGPLTIPTVLAAILLYLPAPAGSDALGNPDAPRGGRMIRELTSDPISLNPITSNDYYATQVNAYIYETLLETDLETYDFRPQVADRWEVAPDGLSFTFHVDPRARFSDGTPITGEDLRYSFEILRADGVNNHFWRSYFQNIDRCELLDPMTVRFTARELYFKNLTMLGELYVVPRHLFTAHDVNTSPLNIRPVGSGPYVLTEWTKGNRIVLERDPDYWGDVLPRKAGRNNVDRLVFKIVRDAKISFEMFKKGEIDFYTFSTRQWVKESSEPPFGTRLKKLDIQYKIPNDYEYIGWNCASELFRDPRVRRAMTLCVDRELLAEKFTYGYSEVCRGPFGDQTEFSSPQVEPWPFDVPGAIRLLREAGWDDHDGDTVVDKDGRPFEFTLITPSQGTIRQLSLMQEDLRKAGVVMHTKVVEWNSFLKLLDDQRFDAVTLMWTGVLDPDPYGLWHSDASVKGGNNYIQYKNAEVDWLIEQVVVSLDRAERIPLLHRIHEILHRDQPYTFLLEPTHQLVGYDSRFRFIQPFYDYGVGYEYWWVPPELRRQGAPQRRSR